MVRRLMPGQAPVPTGTFSLSYPTGLLQPLNQLLDVRKPARHVSLTTLSTEPELTAHDATVAAGDEPGGAMIAADCGSRGSRGGNGDGGSGTACMSSVLHQQLFGQRSTRGDHIASLEAWVITLTRWLEMSLDVKELDKFPGDA